MGLQTGTATVENSMEVAKKLKIKLGQYPIITFCKETKPLSQSDIHTPMFIAVLFKIKKC